ncbi:MAG: LemA family protein [Saprospiraceae bacterium]
MKRNSLILIVVAILLLMVGCNGYNGLVTLDQDAKSQWGQVENQYQRRADLIPNLVNTVKGVANFEQSTLTAVINARASATQIKVDPANLTPEKLQEFQAAQGQLSQALGRLMVVSEQYPELKANQNFLELQSQLEGTENRITVARQDFNNSVQKFNTKAKSFPTNLMACMFGFPEKGFFTAAEGSDKVPEVKF